jgi:hypothetical protein
MPEQVFDDVKWMLDFGAHTGLEMFELFPHPPQLVVGQSLAFGALHGHVPRHGFADVLRTLLHALITGVTEGSDLAAMQQRVRLGDIGDIASCADDGMN